MFICTFCLRVSFNICRLMYIWISDVAVSDGVQCAWILPRARCLLDWMLWSFISGVKIEDFQKLDKYLTACAHTARRDVWGASFCPCETFREKPKKNSARARNLTKACLCTKFDNIKPIVRPIIKVCTPLQIEQCL